MPKHNVSTRNIDTIKATLLRPATTSHFEVIIGLPSSAQTVSTAGQLGSDLRSFLGPNQDKLNLMCCEAVLPGSQLATTEIFNDYTGATERHAYRRIYDETIDLTFYVDAGNYLPIMFFETWMNAIVNEDQDDAVNGNYNYRIMYPDEYVASGLKVIKFEKTGQNQTNRHYGSGQLEYSFVRSYPRSITSMPVTYDASQLLKVSVQMTYLRYVVHQYPGNSRYTPVPGGGNTPFDQAQFNLNGFLSQTAANLVDSVVDRVTGIDIAGDIAGGFAGRWASQQLPQGSNDLLRSIQSGLG